MTRSRHSNCEAGQGGLSVRVNPDNFEGSLRRFKKMVLTDGQNRELRAREAFEKPSDKKRRQKKEAIRRNQRNESMKKRDAV